MKKNEAHRKPRIIITGGGTGGHIFPAIAIANALKSRLGEENILFIGATGKMEMERVPAAGYRIVGLPIQGIQGRLTLHNLILPFRFFNSMLKARKILKYFAPDVVTGVGGFASAPALWMARWMHIPVVIQEQNAIPGKVNRIAGKTAKWVCVAFQGMEKYFPGKNLILTGNPVRKSIAESHTLKQKGCRHYGFNPEKPVLLVIGGSQGARSINHAVAGCIGSWAEQGIQVIWQTGKAFHAEASSLVAPLKNSPIVVFPFIDTMELAYGAATLVVSRAGAIAIAEINTAGLPAILAPFPYAAGDHQTCNALALVKACAATMIKDHELSLKLETEVATLLHDPARLDEMRERSAALAHSDADEKIASLILTLAGIQTTTEECPSTELDAVRVVYFLGAGGIGMSALARWFMLKGKKVFGYDRTETPLTRELEKEGMIIHYNDNPESIPENTDLVVITPAIPSTLNEYRAVLEKKLPMRKRAEILGLISHGLTTIAIAGTHGKTSTSALTTHLLKSAGIPVTAFVGGITKNYNSNFIFTPESRYLVVEADEFDRSFLHLHPDFSVITSTDADHLDIYGTHDSLKEAFISFGNLNGPEKPLIVGSHVETRFNKPFIRYGCSGQLQPYRAENIHDTGERAVFDLVLGTLVLKDITLGIPGLHNIENSIAASAAALWCGVTHEQLREGLASYQGVKRRFDIRIRRDDMIYIDDYAHHPRELAACIHAVRKIYPGRKVTGIFQPHLYSRTRDFAEDFARSLEMLDQVILLEIYPAREEPIAGIHAAMLLNLIQKEDKRLISKEEVIPCLLQIKPEVLLTLGAGDIDTLVPQIERTFIRKEGKP